MFQNIENTLQTVGDWIRFCASEMGRQEVFFGHGTSSALEDARYLVLGALNLPWQTPEMLLNSQLSPNEKSQLNELLKKRIEQRVPTAYLLGKAQFNGLEFYVSEDTLIPRSPISELINQHFEPWLLEEPESILDLCCGSGCLGILAAFEFGQSLVDIADLSKEALVLAQKNIDRYELNGQVTILQGDLFEPCKGKTYDLIICNPPYVDLEDLTQMPAEYQHEPAMALGSGDDGLTLTHQILKQARQYLSPQGIVAVEVGNSGQALEEYYPDVPFSWVDFEQGGHGVFVISSFELEEYFSS